MKQALLDEQPHYPTGIEHLLNAERQQGRVARAELIWRRFNRRVLLAGLLAALGAAGWLHLKALVTNPERFPVNEVSVQGEFRHLQPSDIEVLVARELTGGFFGIDVNKLRARLMKAPWVRDASIRRVWPDALIVTVLEQVPVAAWGPDSLLNDAGEIFTPDPDSLPLGLVQLEGPDSASAQVLERFHSVQQRLEPLGASIESLRLDDRGAWQFKLYRGPVVMVGREHFEQRLERFIDVIGDRLMGGLDRFERIDLRYTNGFAAREHRRQRQAGE
jgi:cell division protein FtsQ